MLGDVFGLALRLTAHSALVIPSIVVSLASDSLLAIVAGPRMEVSLDSPRPVITVAALLWLGRGWLSLTLIAIAFSVTRSEGNVSIQDHWVPSH